MTSANHSPDPTAKPLHVIVGAGQIGPLVAERLLERGYRVRMLRRGNFTGAPAGVETASVEISDPAAAAEAMRGASVVYHCANPRYHRWPRELMPLARGITEGAVRNGARLVVLDNLYMYDLPADGRLGEDTPVAPRSRKGALRIEAADLMLAAHRRGDTAVTIARAADFIGPACMNSLLGERFWTKLLTGKPVEVMGDPDQPHSYSYTRDVADGLVTLGVTDPGAAGNDDVYGRVWHLPTLPADPTRTWIQRFARELGVTPKLSRLSPLLLRMVGLVMPEASELIEMMYQWRGPFRLDDSQFRARFGATPTAVNEVVGATVDWARAHFSPALRAAA